jgi:phosphopantetheine--protein transferase-like protein
MGTKGIGVDLVDIKKFKRILRGKAGRRFVSNTFTKREIECAKGGMNIYKLATSFAAKEAVFKALGTGWIEGKGVEVIRSREEGMPSIVLHGKTRKIAKKMKIKKVLVSLSYTDDCAVAAAIILS